MLHIECLENDRKYMLTVGSGGTAERVTGLFRRIQIKGETLGVQMRVADQEQFIPWKRVTGVSPQ